MTVGLSAANTANKLLETLGRTGTTFTAGTMKVAIHTADPAASGTTAASSNTTKQSLTFAAASAGSMALSSSPTAWSMTATETITHISLWDSAGTTFLWSIALSSSKSVTSGDSLQLTSLTLALTPIAA